MPRRILALLIGAVSLAACGTEPPPFAGTFALTTVFEASPPPFILYQQTTKTQILSRSEILADTLSINADGTWEERTAYRFTENPETAPVVSYPAATGTGTWTIDGDGKLTFTLDAGQGAMLWNLGMKPATLVDATADQLSFQDVVQFYVDFKPRFHRIP